jgi:LAO/AO transport system kinase
LGDDIQAIKAGIMEIADVLVVNKADLPGVENTERALRASLNLAHPVSHRFMHHGKLETVQEPSGPSGEDEVVWTPPILRTVALDGNGIPDLVEAINKHRLHLEASGLWHERERWRIQTEFDLLLQSTLVRDFRSHLPDGSYDQALEDILQRRMSPFQAVEKLVSAVKS